MWDYFHSFEAVIASEIPVSNDEKGSTYYYYYCNTATKELAF